MIMAILTTLIHHANRKDGYLLQNKKRDMPTEDIKKSIESLKKKIEEYEDVLDLLCDVHDNILVKSEPKI